MPQKRLATVTLTSSYQNLSVLLTALGGFTITRVFTAGALKIPSTASNPVRISVVQPPATTGSDALSNLYAAGDQLPFTEMDLTYVWAKGSGGASTLEIEGDDPS